MDPNFKRIRKYPIESLENSYPIVSVYFLHVSLFFSLRKIYRVTVEHMWKNIINFCKAHLTAFDGILALESVK